MSRGAVEDAVVVDYETAKLGHDMDCVFGTVDLDGAFGVGSREGEEFLLV